MRIDPKGTPDVNEPVATDYKSNLLGVPYNSTTENLLDWIGKKLDSMSGGGDSVAVEELKKLLQGLQTISAENNNKDWYIDAEGVWRFVEKFNTIFGDGTANNFTLINPFPASNGLDETRYWGVLANPYNFQAFGVKTETYRLDGNLNKSSVQTETGGVTLNWSTSGTILTFTVNIPLALLELTMFGTYTLSSATVTALSNNSYLDQNGTHQALTLVSVVKSGTNIIATLQIDKSTVTTLGSAFTHDFTVAFDFNATKRIAYRFYRIGSFGTGFQINTSGSANIASSIQNMPVSAVPFLQHTQIVNAMQPTNQPITYLDVCSEQTGKETYSLFLNKFRYLFVRFLPTTTDAVANGFFIDSNKKLFYSSAGYKPNENILERGEKSLINIFREDMFFFIGEQNTQIEITVII
ncbi:MAG: hypothetical protein H6553_06635 [Chitinophagales bacterium]|nr:hypothetical protein [Chitinophagales bacterium]